MSVHEKNLFTLAEHLHTPVYVLKAQMPSSEYFQWIEFFASKHEQERKANSKNLLDSPEKMLKGLVG